ncbi:MAG: PfkB family carbohydrate kinase [Ruthenibacterium lactatiformans]
MDTTGAGDAFLGALLSCLAGKTLEELRILPQAHGSALSRLQTQRAA